jgi:AcrR family transcriptional regulator
VASVSRLSRAELQLRTRAKVLAAARAEFAEHGYRDTTIDRIAARADLTRGAVYSNFPGKRALYFSALTPDLTSDRTPDLTPDRTPDLTPDRTPGLTSDRPPGLAPAGQRARHGRPVSVAGALAAFATAWLGREHPGPEVLRELSDVGPQYAGLLQLNAVFLGLCLDRLEPGELSRMITVARQTLTLLTGATQLAPSVTQPLAVAQTCAHLATLHLPDTWTPPPSTQPVRPASDALDSPDLDGIVLVLGLNRLAAVEDVVRTAARPVTLALVSSSPDELAPLARYTTALLFSCLQQSLPTPRLRLVDDFDGVLASTLGCDVIGDDLEYAVLVDAGRIVARAEGFGAAIAVAQAAISPIPKVRTPSASDAAPSQSIQRN